MQSLSIVLLSLFYVTLGEEKKVALRKFFFYQWKFFENEVFFSRKVKASP